MDIPTTAMDAPTRWWPKALLGAVLLAVVVANPRRVLFVPLLFAVVVPFEKLFPRHRQRLRRPGLSTDLTYAVAQPALTAASLVVGVAVGVLSLAWAPGLLLRPAVAALPPVVRTATAVVLFDLAIYWAHRWSHEVPFLWRFHSVHHSSERMDWISAVRAHPFDGSLLAPVVVFLIAAGFSPRLSGALAIAQAVIGVFLHANVRWRWRPLQKVVITPEFHHWHHANEPDALNTNYAVFLPVWDLLFGTYFMPRDRRPMLYGVSEPMPTTFIGQLRHPLRGLQNPLVAARHPIDGLRSLRRALRRGRSQLIASMRRPARRPSYTL
ncbi:MAG TPA: sterol desaturase family protein [Acidimicrobiales bacterium]|nr:sterol desaturase family protein [Acidimicrobiales bacterium]